MLQPDQLRVSPIPQGGSGIAHKIVAPQPLIGPQQAGDRLGQDPQGSGLPGHHMLVKLGRPPHRLACVVDDEIQPVPGLEQVLAECLHTGSVPEIQPENLQTIPPLLKIRLLRIPLR